MKWTHPPIPKIYEALGAIVDNRIEVLDNSARVYSSSGNKFYNVEYSPEQNAIMANDNASYWKGYLGYPAIAFLLKIGVLKYNTDLASLLKDIKWKDINQKFKDDFDKALEFILMSLDKSQKLELALYIKKLDEQLKALNLTLLGKKVRPPAGY